MLSCPTRAAPHKFLCQVAPVVQMEVKGIWACHNGDTFGLMYESAKHKIRNLKYITILKSKKLPFLCLFYCHKCTGKVSVYVCVCTGVCVCLCYCLGYNFWSSLHRNFIFDFDVNFDKVLAQQTQRYTDTHLYITN